MKFVARHGDETFPLEVQRTGTGYVVHMPEGPIALDVVRANRFLRSVRLADGRQYLIAHHSEGARHEISIGSRTVVVELRDPLTMKRKRIEEEGGAGVVVAIMPGRVVRVQVAVGDEIVRGAPLLILEAMKMQNEIVSPKGGKVTAVMVSDGQTVESGAELLRIE